MTGKPSTIAVERAERVMARCAALAAFTDEPGRITRAYGTPALRAAQDEVAGWMRAAEMTVSRDAVGNLIGRYEAAVAGAPAFLIGGHLDSVRDAGKYDGILGVLSGVAAVERLHGAGRRLPFAVEVVAFADEEGLRFHTAYLGSRALVGTVDEAMLELADADGMTVAAAIEAFGGSVAALPHAQRQPDELVGFVEVHIEQGPILEAQGLPVGTVAAIAGGTRAEITFLGEAGHAGTTPMDRRRDALAAAAEAVLAVERVGEAEAGMVATVGELDVAPGASNVIPGRVRLTLDLRHADDAKRDRAEAELRRHVAVIAARRRVEMIWRVIQGYASTVCDAALTERLAAAVVACGVEDVRLTSGAGHDAVPLAGLLPVAMLFVRCAGGISHNPAESVDVTDVAVACAVLDKLLDDLAR
jgi:hydantoinase/carbamoylase family amidase